MARQPIQPGRCRRTWFCALLVLAGLGESVGFGQIAAERPMAGPGGQYVPPATAPGGSQPPATPTETLVVEVRVEGNRTIGLDKIRQKIHTYVGRPYVAETIERDVRALNQMGVFASVRPLTQRVPEGVIVIFQVVERPLLQDVIIIGNDTYTTKSLKKETDLRIGDAADPFAVENGRRKIEDYYQKKGYSKVRVTVLEGNKAGDLRAVYVVNEGPHQRIWSVDFVGNSFVTSARLKTLIQSHPPYFYLFSGEVDRKQIEEDVAKLTAYYRSFGYFRARISREYQFGPDQNWLTLTFVIDEGPRYVVRNVSFQGNRKLANGRLAEKVKLLGGQYFDQNQQNLDVQVLRDEYGGEGYVFAKVDADNRFLEEPGKLDIVYNVDEGDRYRVGRINIQIKGENPHTKITTVLNRLSFKPGDIVDTREIRASERRLKASQLYKVEPSRNIEPKIAYSPPELEDKDTAVAGRRRTSYYRVPGGEAPLPPGERYVDLDINAGEPQPEAQTAPCSADNASPPALQGQGYGPAAAAPNMTYQQPQAGPNAYGPQSNVPQQQQPTVFQARYESQQALARNPSEPQGQGWAPVGGYANVNGYATQPRQTGSQAQPVAYTTSAPQPAPNYGAPSGVGPAYNYPNVPPAGSAGAARPGGATADGPIAEMANGGSLFEDPSPMMFPTPTGDPLRDLPIQIDPQETQTGRLMFGVGVNSDAGIVGNITLDEQNFDWRRVPSSWADVIEGRAFRGNGERFRMELVPGSQVQRYLVSFQDPYFLNQPVSFGLSGFFYQRLFSEWTESRVGGSVSFGYQFTHDLTGTVRFQAQDVNVMNAAYPVPELLSVLGRNQLYTFSASLAHDTRDNPFMATEGHLISAAIEETLGTFQYPRASVEWSQYFRIFERADRSGKHVLSLNMRAAYTGDQTPIFERFYAGGFSTIRGYSFRGVTPRDPVYGMGVGGNFQMLATAQYMFPITADDMLRGVVFVDAGTVEPRITQWVDTVRVAPGFGLRISIPMMGPAPIALDFAFPVTKEPGDVEQVFSFFVGFNH